MLNLFLLTTHAAEEAAAATVEATVAVEATSRTPSPVKSESGALPLVDEVAPDTTNVELALVASGDAPATETFHFQSPAMSALTDQYNTAVNVLAALQDQVREAQRTVDEIVAQIAALKAAEAGEAEGAKSDTPSNQGVSGEDSDSKSTHEEAEVVPAAVEEAPAAATPTQEVIDPTTVLQEVTHVDPEVTVAPEANAEVAPEDNAEAAPVATTEATPASEA